MEGLKSYERTFEQIIDVKNDLILTNIETMFAISCMLRKLTTYC